MSESEVQAVIQRADVISYGTMAEMSHFQKERCRDFKLMMQDYLKGQIEFYKQVRLQIHANVLNFVDKFGSPILLSDS